MHDEWIVDFLTLGDLWDAWVQAHCKVPDGFDRGEPFVWSDWQFWNSANFGRIKEGLAWEGKPLRNQAFHYRRGQVIGPQKTGKGPYGASLLALHAVGPSEFDGYAAPGEVFRCSDNGCYCGFVHEYLPGEPKGRRHPSPLIQMTGSSEEQVEANIYRHLRSMITLGPLAELMADRGDFVRIFGEIGGDDADRIDVTTSSAKSRLGNPISFALQDETGTWTKSNKMMNVAHTQRRGLAGMGGRSLEMTNAYDSSEASVAQETRESRAKDVWKFYTEPPANLSWQSVKDRRQILEIVYRGSPWVSIDSILAEAAELSETDPEQAERFFGNRITYSSGTWLPAGLWEEHLHVAVQSA